MALYDKGLTAYAESDLDEAYDHLTRAVEADRRNAPAWMALGVVEH